MRSITSSAAHSPICSESRMRAEMGGTWKRAAGDSSYTISERSAGTVMSSSLIAEDAIGRDAARVSVEQDDWHLGLGEGGMDALCPLVGQADDQPIDTTL